MKDRLLTLEDLYSYYSSSSRSVHFSAKDENKNLVVQVPGNLVFEKKDDTEGLTKVILQACHTLENNNKTYIADDVMGAALPSFSNRPILAYIHEVDGQWEFYSHNRHQDEDGNIVYDETPVGIIPESASAHLEYDEEKGHNYVVVTGYIFDEYSKAKEIIERNGGCSTSVELSVRELSYNAKDKVLNIEDFYFSGVTLLGKTPEGKEVKPGMEGSNLKLADFRNSVFAQEDLVARVAELEKKFSDLSIKENLGKEDDMTKFEELLQKYEKTAEDVTFEYENLTDEELEKAFAEAFEQSDPQPESTPEPENFTKTFELSHEDVRCALYELLMPYEEADEDWYYIESVYDDYFVYGGCRKNKHYGQKYTKGSENVAFDGERYELFVEYLTESEKATLEQMRGNYEEISSKLAKYEAEPAKMEILNSSDYSYVADTEEFEALKSVEAHFDLTEDEVRSKCDEILMKYAKNQAFSNVEKPVSRVNFAQAPKKQSRYGNIFSK